jgi:hypothetical protein
MFRYRNAVVLIILLTAPFIMGKNKTIQRETLTAYVERMQQQRPEVPSGTPGSLWTDNSRLAFLTGDYPPRTKTYMHPHLHPERLCAKPHKPYLTAS